LELEDRGAGAETRLDELEWGEIGRITGISLTQVSVWQPASRLCQRGSQLCAAVIMALNVRDEGRVNFVCKKTRTRTSKSGRLPNRDENEIPSLYSVY